MTEETAGWKKQGTRRGRWKEKARRSRGVRRSGGSRRSGELGRCPRDRPAWELMAGTSSEEMIPARRPPSHGRRRNDGSATAVREEVGQSREKEQRIGGAKTLKSFGGLLHGAGAGDVPRPVRAIGPVFGHPLHCALNTTNSNVSTASYLGEALAVVEQPRGDGSLCQSRGLAVYRYDRCERCDCKHRDAYAVHVPRCQRSMSRSSVPTVTV
jgi:hypothetical protein